MVTNMITFSANLINRFYAGRLDDSVKIAVIGLSGSINLIFMISIMIGINSAQETLTSQAFGARNLPLVGIYLNRGRFILIAIFIPLALVIAFAGESILIGLG